MTRLKVIVAMFGLRKEYPADRVRVHAGFFLMNVASFFEWHLYVGPHVGYGLMLEKVIELPKLQYTSHAGATDRIRSAQTDRHVHTETHQENPSSI